MNEGVEGKAVAEALVEVVHVHSGIACKIRVKSRRKRRKKERKEEEKVEIVPFVFFLTQRRRASLADNSSKEISWIWKRRIMVQVRPRIRTGFPSTISLAPMFSRVTLVLR